MNFFFLYCFIFNGIITTPTQNNQNFMKKNEWEMYHKCWYNSENKEKLKENYIINM